MIRGEPVPRLIDGRFELVRCLGGGGMGLVWQARDTALHRDVALKEVRPPDPAAGDTADSIDARELRQRVLREARALARLHHPNVVIIHHIVDTPDHPHPWLVMELVTGGSLADRLARGPLSVPEAARIGRSLLSALRAAHAVGILHRDIKPGNVLLRPDGSPVLTDFGIAAVRDATALTVSGSVVGSPEYIAPERLRGAEGNPSSDLWSLAMMLYVAVEGRHPLRRATVLATLAAVLDEPLPPPVYAGPLGPALSAMLAKDPAQRPDADRFDRLLAAVEYSHPVPPPMPPPWSPPAPRQPASISMSVPSGHALGTPGHSLRSGAQPTIPPRPARRGRAALITLAVVVLAAAGVLTWTLLPRATGSSGTPTALDTGRPQTTQTQTQTNNRPAAPPAPANLLTPDGMRATIRAMTPTMGTKVLQLVVYQEYASAEAETAADPELYDDIAYRDGSTTKSAGGTVNDTLQAPIDLSTIDWDILPALLAKAQATLNVPNPTTIYVMVDSDMRIDDNGNTSTRPVIRIYRADNYGGGFLMTDLKGNILNTVPRS